MQIEDRYDKQIGGCLSASFIFVPWRKSQRRFLRSSLQIALHKKQSTL